MKKKIVKKLTRKSFQVSGFSIFYPSQLRLLAKVVKRDVLLLLTGEGVLISSLTN